MATVIETLIKREGETRVYYFDFADKAEVAAGQTLTGSPTVTSATAGLTLGSATIASGNQKVQVQVSGGSHGVGYLLECTCGTSGGATLVVFGKLSVLDPES